VAEVVRGRLFQRRLLDRVPRLGLVLILVLILGPVRRHHHITVTIPVIIITGHHPTIIVVPVPILVHDPDLMLLVPIREPVLFLQGIIDVPSPIPHLDPLLFLLYPLSQVLTVVRLEGEAHLVRLTPMSTTTTHLVLVLLLQGARVPNYDRDHTHLPRLA